MSTAPEIDASKLDTPFSSKIYDKDGEFIADLGAEQRTKVDYNELPEILIEAVTATEDSRFFEHHGIDIRRIGGAIIANFTDGFGSEGASTITQQVVEKAFLSPDKKISLKVQEQWLALQLEQEYSKKQILEMYLNKIYYGSGAYGVAKAAEIYFGKTDLKELTLPEAAILAGLPQRPSAYNPFKNPELMKERMNTVLDLMVMHGKISKEQADEARKTDIPSLLREDRPDSSPYEAFLQKVRKEVEQKIDGADIYTDGLEIYTTLDTKAQEHVEFLLSDNEENPINYPAEKKDAEGKMVEMKAGLVVLDSKSGAIRAIGGAPGNLEDRGKNYALSLNRQPGSTMKPIMAYGPAIEYEKWSTYHQIENDHPYQIPGTTKQARNWNDSYSGPTSMRRALVQSLNVPALNTTEEIGTAKAKKFAEGLGVSFKEEPNVMDTIGGYKFGSSPLEMATAYRGFANGGISSDSYAVTKVVYPDGQTVELKPEQKAVMADYTAYMITDMLKDVLTESYGTGGRANVSGLPVAGKTGTTNREDNKNGSPDSWFNGYTTNYTISVWTGYDDPKNVLEGKETQVALDLFRNTMAEISKGIDTPDFTKPDSVVELGVEKGSVPAKLPSPYTPSSMIVKELFVKGNTPNKTSQKYDQLDPVSNLTANYDKESESIKVEWDYDSNTDVTFDVSASVNGGQMQGLSSTEDTSLEISSVEPGSKYQIQVVVVSNESKVDNSKPATTKVNVPGENDEEDEAKEMKVSNVQASFDPNTNNVSINWDYEGPSANYDVVIKGISSQTVSTTSASYNLEFPHSNKKYIVSVTPVNTEGEKGKSQNTSFTVPDNSSESGNEGNGQSNDNGSGNNNNEDNNDDSQEEKEASKNDKEKKDKKDEDKKKDNANESSEND